MPLQTPPASDKLEVQPLLTPEEFRALVRRHRRNDTRTTYIQWHGPITSALVLFIGLMWLALSESWSLILGALIFVFANVLIARLSGRNAHKEAMQGSRMVQFILTTQNAKMLGSILDLYGTCVSASINGISISAAMNHAVERLVPLIQASDADAFNTRHRTHLRGYLYSCSCNAFEIDLFEIDLKRVNRCLSTLRALEQIGDKRDLPDIERLLKERYITDEIRVATERCIQAIRERVTKEAPKNVLLRPDRKPEYEETLLRPSIENADTPPQQLLRVSTSDVHDPPG